MSKSFSSMQYEGPFRPGHGLSNWEQPRQHKEMPDKRVGKTQIVATNRGHLIPGAANRSLEDPWGNFEGTWDMSTKIKGIRADVTTARSMFGMARLQLPPRPPKRNQELKQMQRMNEVVKAGGAIQFIKHDGTGKTPSPIPPEERGAVPVDPMPDLPFPAPGVRSPGVRTPQEKLSFQPVPLHLNEDVPSLPHGPGFLPPAAPEPESLHVPSKATPSPPPMVPSPQDNPAGNEVAFEEPTNPANF